MVRVCRVVLFVWSRLQPLRPARVCRRSNSASRARSTMAPAWCRMSRSRSKTRRARPARSRPTASGNIRSTACGAGEYQLIVGREGYASATRTVVLTEQSRTVDITLQVGALSTSVDVVGAASGALTNSLTASTNAGSRLDLTALDTPASVTTLSGTDIRLRGDLSVNSSVTRAVGVTSTFSVGGGGNTVAARGFGGIVDRVHVRRHPQPGGPRQPRLALRSVDDRSHRGLERAGVGAVRHRRHRRLDQRHPAPPEPPRRAYGAAGGRRRTTPIGWRSTAPARSPVRNACSIASTSAGRRPTATSTAASRRARRVSGALDFLISPKLKATLINDFAYIEPMNYNGLPMINGVGAAVAAAKRTTAPTTSTSISTRTRRASS